MGLRYNHHLHQTMMGDEWSHIFGFRGTAMTHPMQTMSECTISDENPTSLDGKSDFCEERVSDI